ncbi:MAG: hypothetical protein R2799_12185 [Crocinitomicaceae bacterium]
MNRYNIIAFLFILNFLIACNKENTVILTAGNIEGHSISNANLIAKDNSSNGGSHLTLDLNNDNEIDIILQTNGRKEPYFNYSTFEIDSNYFIKTEIIRLNDSCYLPYIPGTKYYYYHEILDYFNWGSFVIRKKTTLNLNVDSLSQGSFIRGYTAVMFDEGESVSPDLEFGRPATMVMINYEFQKGYDFDTTWSSPGDTINNYVNYYQRQTGTKDTLDQIYIPYKIIKPEGKYVGWISFHISNINQINLEYTTYKYLEKK